MGLQKLLEITRENVAGYNGCLNSEELNLPEAGNIVAKWRLGEGPSSQRGQVCQPGNAIIKQGVRAWPSSGPSEFTALMMTHVLCKKGEPVVMK